METLSTAHATCLNSFCGFARLTWRSPDWWLQWRVPCRKRGKVWQWCILTLKNASMTSWPFWRTSSPLFALYALLSWPSQCTFSTGTFPTYSTIWKPDSLGISTWALTAASMMPSSPTTPRTRRSSHLYLFCVYTIQLLLHSNKQETTESVMQISWNIRYLILM